MLVRRPAWVALLLLLGTLGCGKDPEPSPRKGGPAPAAVDAGEPVGAPGDPPPGAVGGTRPAEEEEIVLPKGFFSRWYERLQEGKKVGWLHVVWQPSTWQGKPTVRDTTTIVTRSGRAMLQQVDVFETRAVLVTERGDDGTLWTTKATVTEPTSSGTRTTTSETTWTGTGYDLVTRLEDAPEERRRVEAAAPAHVDSEALLSKRIAAGQVKAGTTEVLRTIDAAARRVKEQEVSVVARESVRGASGPVECWKVREHDPETGSETFLWIDDEGAFVRVKDLATEVRRVTSAEAKRVPEEVPSFSITVAAQPPLERIFSADRVLLDVKMPHDADRPLPDFPASPWSRVLAVEGNEASGWVVKVEMRAYDATEKTAVIPVVDPAFERHLEPTALMECRDPRVLAAAKAAVGTETDARKAAQRLADFVFTLRKQSPEVGQTSAVEILEQRRGDCSEHALLFVALCRAAGIPARQCSGYVCIGGDWGAHAWAEIWTGQWIGVDPTTCDVGMSARYLFFGYHDEPGSHPGVVSARSRGRMTFVATRLEEGKEVVDLTDPAAWRVVDEEKRRAHDRLSGVELADWPADWTVALDDDAGFSVRAPGLEASVDRRADQGYRTKNRIRRVAGADQQETTFAGVPAWVRRQGASRLAVVNHRRCNLIVQAVVRGAAGEASWERLEKVVAPTLSER